MLERVVVIVNRLGMHARAAALFVKTSNQFQSTVEISKGKTRVDGKNIMGIMMLAAAKGDKVIIHTHGVDEKKALKTLSNLIGKKFGEEAKKS